MYTSTGKDTVEKLRVEFPRGTRIVLDHMDDPYTKIPAGSKGTVTGVDDTGTVHVSWDCGSGLGLVYGVDEYHKEG